MSEMITITINNTAVTVPKGTTILEAARNNDIFIPTLCYMEGVSDIGMCRLCIVEVEGNSRLPAACRTKAMEGMVITTESERLTRYRREMLRMILSHHLLECMNCPAKSRCELKSLCKRYGVNPAKYCIIRTDRNAIPKDAPFISYDPDKCIYCLRCISACHSIAGNGVLDIGRNGNHIALKTPFETGFKESGCENCGTCTSVCPAGALTLKS